MFKPKNLICYTIAAAVLSTMTSCSLKDIEKNFSKRVNAAGNKINDVIEERSNSEASLEENIKNQTCRRVIDALQNKDANTIKDMFSVQAKRLCPNLDEKIDCLIDMYEGEYVKCEHHNASVNSYSGDNARIVGRAICVFQTTEKRYELTWTSMSECKKKDKEGLYTIKLRILPDEEPAGGGKDLHIAGITTPDIFTEEDVLWELYHVIYHYQNAGDSITGLRDLLSNKLLETGITDDDLKRFLEFTDEMSNYDDGWIEYDENGKTTTYIQTKWSDNVMCVCFGLDDEQPDKISFLKAIDVTGKDLTLGEYNMAEEEPWIYYVE